MVERVIVLLAAYGSIFVYDRSLWQSESSRAEKAAYIILMMVSLYFAVDYALAFPFDFPGIYELADLVFTDMARTIDKWLTLPNQ
ncbi:hypothetical protein [Paenibacillus sp. PL2-23]|uniref:hypothetical protein n=1 Tax=Paenibacillus sp. PL2-23 TaxID=2100729 RepID=UPI0030FB3B61